MRNVDQKGKKVGFLNNLTGNLHWNGPGRPGSSAKDMEVVMEPIDPVSERRPEMGQRTGTYEVKNGLLMVNGETAGIDRRVVGEVVRQFQEQTGRQTSFLPLSVVDRILALDRTIGLARLQSALHGLCA